MILAAYYHTILAFLFAAVAVVLMGVILLQRGKGVGLAGAFGGTGGGTAFGAKTGDILTWFTIILAAVLLTFTVVLNYVFVPIGPGLGTGAPEPGAPGNPTIETPAQPAESGGEGAWHWTAPSAVPLCCQLPIFGVGHT